MPIHELICLLSDWSMGTGPLYQKLAGRLAELIDEGVLAAEMLLPSERTMAAALSISRRTVEAANNLLWAQGLVQRRTGVGTWCTPGRPVPSIGLAAATRSEEYIEHLLSDSRSLDLTVAGLPAHPLVAEARQAGRDLGMEMRYDTHGYLPAGLRSLRAEICAWFADHGLPTTPDQIAVTSGASQALWLVAALLPPASKVYVENPTSPAILNALRTHRLRLRTVPGDDGGMDADAVPFDPAAAVFLTPTYCNPSGAHLSAARCRLLADFACAGMTVVEDLALADIRLDGPPARAVATLAPDATVLSVGSVSKLFWGGLRLGWVRGQPALIRRINRLKASLDLGTGLDVQAQAAWLLRRRDEVRVDRLPQLRIQRAAMLEALSTELPHWRWRVPEGGLSLWLELPGAEAGSLCLRAQRMGLRLLTGRAFDVRRQDERHLRLPFVHSPAMGREIVRRLAMAARLPA